MKKFLVNIALLLVIGLCFESTAYGQRVLGGYKSASTSDPAVVEAAEFAVGKKSEEQEGLTLDSVDKAEIQTVGGTNYRICMTVSLDEESQQVKVIIYRNPKKEFEIKSWTVETCAEKN